MGALRAGKHRGRSQTHTLIRRSRWRSWLGARPARERSINESLLVASGSADPFAYVYDVSGSDHTGKLLQRLEGHTDRVNAICFHPTDTALATGSSDSSIRLWYARMRRLPIPRRSSAASPPAVMA